ncbi:SRPBCC domain-containing protein [Vibrio sp. CAU 1672]|uniref:SRPBCC domain-containing protein n=1 Tax=Vibrio sp. CAU 1672 TaxID=3032594 RepID=UPI0023DC9D60|nr:SRPBCC domain-containing protein [Vibrio sp. CAU 1672]MDF2152631.1 SRPBCC domain-containing protein [Vibrio sp. CAU 1672]
MLSLSYHVEIGASPQRVWKVLTNAALYQRWVQVFSPQSHFDANWQECVDLTFTAPDMDGPRALIDTVPPFETLEYHHVATFDPRSCQCLGSDITARWTGSRETYQLSMVQQRLLLSVTIQTHSDFVTMFNYGWEKALPLIKAISEEEP